MKRIESLQDDMNGTVTYDLGNGRFACYDRRAVECYGLAALLADEGIELKQVERVPVMQHGRRVGTLPGLWDPVMARSTTFLYSVRPDDFRRTDDAWVASPSLGPGDLEAVAGFVWDRGCGR